MILDMKIPTYRFEKLDTVQEALKEINSDRDVVALRTFEVIKYGLKNELLNVYLFDLILSDGLTYSVRFGRDEWESSLAGVLKYLEETEQYEKCVAVNKLLKKIKSAY